MNQDRWKIVNRIFHAALEVEPTQRESLVAAESNGDLEVQAEVRLLLKADSEGGSFLDKPLISENSLSPPAPVSTGDVLCGRFRIVRQIGEGGMGYVFEAFDSELSAPVAIKMIRPELMPNREAVARFRQEARLALTITDPNVCRTFDIQREIRIIDGKRTELVFLTMELLRGETLAAHIKRVGKLQAPVAFGLARQIASALRAAHSLGVIHRDMKPANIMLVNHAYTSQVRTRVVVMDFGLARVDPLLPKSGNTAFSKTGHAIGTLGYMAPEQLEVGPVSPSTDIYSFGLIVFEMITGEPAFPSDNLLSGIAKRLNGSIVLKQLQSPDIRPNWRRAIEWCIASDPSQRPKDVANVIELLEEGRRWFLPRLKGPYSLARHPAYRIYSGVAAILVILALFFSGLRLYESRGDSKVTPGTLVYLTPVRNETGNKSLDSLTELIRAGLSQSTQVNLLDPGRVEEILRQMTKPPNSAIDATTAREIAMRSGSPRVVFATVTGSNSRYVLSIEIQKPDNTPSRYREHWTKSFAWQSSVESQDSKRIPGNLLEQVRSASDWIRREVGESANDIAQLDTPPEDATTNNWDALDDYSRAEELLLRRKTDDGITALERATQLDREFSLAFARLGDVLFSVNRWSEGLTAYRQAMSTTGRERLSRRELDRVRGIYASDTRDYATAEAQFRDIIAYYPSDWKAWFYRAVPLMRLGRLEEAIECLKRAHTLAPERLSPVATLAQFSLHGTGLGTDGWLAELRRLGYNTEAAWIEGEQAILRADPKAAKHWFEVVSNSSSPVRAVAGYQLLARVEAEEGSFAQAQEVLNKALQLAASQGDNGDQAVILMDRAWLHCQLGQVTDCAQDAEKSLSINRSPQVLRASSLLVIRSASLPLHGQQKLLLRLLQHIGTDRSTDEIGPLFDMAQLERQGALQLVNRNCEAALEAFRAEAAIDAPVDSREYLAFALDQCARWERSPMRAQSLRREAADAYAVAAFEPALVWDMIQFHPPGAYADQLSGWLRTTGERGKRYDQTSEILQHLRLSEFPRGTSHPGRPDASPQSTH